MWKKGKEKKKRALAFEKLTEVYSGRELGWLLTITLAGKAIAKI